MSTSLFDHYVKNWEAVKRHPDVHVEPDLDDVFVCPLCFKAYPREALETKDITLEHVPPKAVGGKVRTLTCKPCNNRAGTELDSQLLDFEKARDFFTNTPGSSIEAELPFDDNTSFPFTVHLKEGEGFHLIMEGHPERTNPDHLARIKELLHNTNRITLNFLLYKQHRPDVALLRTAYLWAFSVFGYGFLMNPSLRVIREQIKNPADRILPAWDLRGRFPDRALGISVITEPKELRSFVVVFDTVSPKGQSTRHGIILPGPSKPGLGIYKWLAEGPPNQPRRISFTHIAEEEARSAVAEDPFASHTIWRAWVTSRSEE